MPPVSGFPEIGGVFVSRDDMTATSWQNRITRYGEEPPDQLLAHPLNFRMHPKHQQDALAGVLGEVGIVQNVIVNERTGHVVDGHLRISLAMRQNQPTVPVTYVDLSESEEALILATLDPISSLATADADKLRDLLEDVSTGDAALMQMISDMAEREGIVDFGGTDLLTDPDDVPPVPDDPITKPGDLWMLGRHRLLCGDSTYMNQVERLMDGEKADMVFTDPPYGVNVSGKGGDAIHGDLTSTAIFMMFDVLPRVVAKGAWFYIFGGSSNFAQYQRLFDHHFRQLPGLIVWDKGKTAVMRHNGYHSSYELIYFTYLEGGGARWFSDRTSDSADDIWRVPVDSKPNRDHPTQKPIEIPARAIRNSCPPNGLVFEPFSGSGSTLLAAEKEGRRCYAVELDPAYCDVIVRRWENATGQTATRATEAMAAD